MIDVEQIRILIDEIFNKKNLDAINQLYADNFVSHDPQNPREGRSGVREWVEELTAAAPDFHLDIHDVLIDGDMTASRWTASGTHAADWRDVPATNLPFAITGITISKYSDGMIVESWVNADNLGMLQQLGLVPQTAS